jgi:GT2 family glycosyltransferase
MENAAREQVMPVVSAVVVNFNGGDRVLNTLDALRAQTAQLEQVIVVDNGSVDGSVDKIRRLFPAVQILAMGVNRGPSAARNVGIRRADTELVLLVDSDVYLEPNCLAQMLQAYGTEGSAVVCPRIVLMPERELIQLDGADAHFVGTMILRHGYQRVDKIPAEVADVGGAASGCLLMHRNRVLEAGGFDELYFFYFEDHEFALRMRERGHRIVCEPRAVAFHDRGQGTPGLSFRGKEAYPARRAYLTMRHRLLTLFIHYRVRTLMILLPALVLYEFATLTVALSRGWATEWAAAWWWQLRNVQLILARRRTIQRARVLDDKQLLVGGALPLAPGFVQSRAVNLIVRCLSGVLSGYWTLARRLIG